MIKEWFEKYSRWKLGKARKLLENETQARIGIAIIDATSKLNTDLKLFQKEREDYKQIAGKAEKDLESATQAYAQDIQRISGELETVRNRQEFFLRQAREQMSALESAHKEATLQLIHREFPDELVAKLGLDAGLVTAYKQERATVISLLERLDYVKNELLKTEAEKIELETPMLAGLPIAVVTPTDVAYSTKKFQKRTHAISPQHLIEEIWKNETVYSLLRDGKEAQLKVSSNTKEIYNLTLVPYIPKRRKSPEAVFVYLNPAPEKKILGKILKRTVGDMKDKIAHRLGRVSEYFHPHETKITHSSTYP